MSKIEEYVEVLVLKARNAEQSGDALKFSQAATNAANALCALKSAEHIGSAESK